MAASRTHYGSTVNTLPRIALSCHPNTGDLPVPFQTKRSHAKPCDPPSRLQHNLSFTPSTTTMEPAPALTGDDLRALDKKPYIKIQWRADKSSMLEMVFEEFPKAVAMAFSRAIKNHFTTVAPAGNKYIVEGGSLQVYQFIFDWMIKSSREAAIAPFSTSYTKQFYGNLHIYSAASQLGLSCFKNEIFSRLATLADTEIQGATDINDLYHMFNAGHPLRAMIAKGTVKCFLEGKFGKVGKTYQEYFGEIEEAFEDDTRRFFKAEMKDFDPQWAEKMRRKEVTKGAVPPGPRWYVNITSGSVRRVTN
jgi:hypothetical protein